MKAFFLNSEPGMRGGEYQTIALAEGLVKKGCEISLMVRSDSSIAKRAAGSFKVLEVPFERVPFETPIKIRRFADEWKPDVIHTHTSLAHTHARLASLFRGSFPPLVVSRRVAFDISKGIWGYFKYRVGVAMYIAISDAVGKKLKEGGISMERISVIPSGVDTAALRKGAEYGRMNDEWRSDESDMVIGTVAPFEREKGYYTLLKAAESVLQKYEHCKFVFVGKGSLEEDIRRVIRTMGLNGRVIVANPERTIERILSEFDIFVLASKSEGLSTALLSALAVGVPAVASDAGGIQELIGRGGGILVKSGDHEALARALEELVKDPGRRRRLSNSGMETATAFDISRTVDGTYEVYRRVIGE